MRSLSTPNSRRMRGRFAVALVGDGDEQVLDADVLVLQAVGLGVRRLQEADDARRRVDLDDVVGQLRRAVERLGDALRQPRGRRRSARRRSAAASPPGCCSSARKTCSTSHWECRCWRTISWEAASTSCACCVNLSCLIMVVYLVVALSCSTPTEGWGMRLRMKLGHGCALSRSGPMPQASAWGAEKPAS